MTCGRSEDRENLPCPSVSSPVAVCPFRLRCPRAFRARGAHPHGAVANAPFFKNRCDNIKKSCVQELDARFFVELLQRTGKIARICDSPSAPSSSGKGRAAVLSSSGKARRAPFPRGKRRPGRKGARPRPSSPVKYIKTPLPRTGGVGGGLPEPRNRRGAAVPARTSPPAFS